MSSFHLDKVNPTLQQCDEYVTIAREGTEVTVPKAHLEMLKQMHSSVKLLDHKVLAIKMYKTFFPMGLYEAKMVIDAACAIEYGY